MTVAKTPQPDNQQKSIRILKHSQIIAAMPIDGPQKGISVVNVSGGQKVAVSRATKIPKNLV